MYDSDCHSADGNVSGGARTLTGYGALHLDVCKMPQSLKVQYKLYKAVYYTWGGIFRLENHFSFDPDYIQYIQA